MTGCFMKLGQGRLLYGMVTFGWRPEESEGTSVQIFNRKNDPGRGTTSANVLGQVLEEYLGGHCSLNRVSRRESGET